MHKRRPPLHDEDTGLLGHILDGFDAISDLNKRLRVPTHPVYDSTNFPEDAVRGQIVRDVNDTSVLWVFGEDDEWHQIGGSGIELANGSSIGAWNLAPGDSGDIDIFVFDSTSGTFTLRGDNKAILVHDKGIYFAGVNAQIFSFTGRPAGTRMAVAGFFPGGTNFTNFAIGTPTEVAIPGTTDTWTPNNGTFLHLPANDTVGVPVSMRVYNYDSVMVQVHVSTLFLVKLTSKSMTLY